MKKISRKLSGLFVAFVAFALIACGSPAGGGDDNPSSTAQSNVKMKSSTGINGIFLELGAGSGDLKTLEPSATAPGAGVVTKKLSDTGSLVDVLAWCDGNTIWYYAAGYTDTAGKKIPLDNYSYLLFEDCLKLTKIDVSKLDTSNSTNIWGMFSGCKALTEIIGLNTLDTSKANSFQSMFSSCESLTSIDISSFNTSNVTDMNYMFGFCKSLQSIEFGNMDTSKVTKMANMFSWCEALEELDISSFDTSHVTDMDSMFYSCKALRALNVSNFNTSNVAVMRDMFSRCENLTTLDLSNFDTRSVTTIYGMFSYCSRLTTIYAASGANWGQLSSPRSTAFNYTFLSCSKLKGGAGTKYSPSCESSGTYARIDGGSSNPGYFSVKP